MIPAIENNAVGSTFKEISVTTLKTIQFRLPEKNIVKKYNESVSDRTIRNSAKNNLIPYHGMIWVFDQLVKNNIISKSEASGKLTQLITTNLVFQNNKELVAEMEKRCKPPAKPSCLLRNR